MRLLYSNAAAVLSAAHRHGAVAHLGERFNGIEEVGGSSPPSSIRLKSAVGIYLQIKSIRS